MSCYISLINDNFHSTISSCSQGKYNVTIGDNYCYNVTVTNFLGISSISNSISKFLAIIYTIMPYVSKNVGQETN